MGIGASIFLIAVGAVLAFAITFTVTGVDLVMVGWILMVAGGIGLIWSLIHMGMRRRQTIVQEHRHDGETYPQR